MSNLKQFSNFHLKITEKQTAQNMTVLHHYIASFACSPSTPSNVQSHKRLLRLTPDCFSCLKWWMLLLLKRLLHSSVLTMTCSRYTTTYHMKVHVTQYRPVNCPGYTWSFPDTREISWSLGRVVKSPGYSKKCKNYFFFKWSKYVLFTFILVDFGWFRDV